MVERFLSIKDLPGNQDSLKQAAIIQAIEILRAAHVEDAESKAETIFRHHTFTFYPERGGFVVMKDGREVRLTRTESNLLGIMARKPGRVAEFPELGTALNIQIEADAQRLVKWHIKSIRRKLEPGVNVGEYKILLSVRGFGYMLCASDSENETS